MYQSRAIDQRAIAAQMASEARSSAVLCAMLSVCCRPGDGEPLDGVGPSAWEVASYNTALNGHDARKVLTACKSSHRAALAVASCCDDADVLIELAATGGPRARGAMLKNRFAPLGLIKSLAVRFRPAERELVESAVVSRDLDEDMIRTILSQPVVTDMVTALKKHPQMCAKWAVALAKIGYIGSTEHVARYIAVPEAGRGPELSTLVESLQELAEAAGAPHRDGCLSFVVDLCRQPSLLLLGSSQLAPEVLRAVSSVPSALYNLAKGPLGPEGFRELFELAAGDRHILRALGNRPECPPEVAKKCPRTATAVARALEDDLSQFEMALVLLSETSEDVTTGEFVDMIRALAGGS